MELILTSFLSPILWVIPQGAVHNICSNLHPTDISQVRDGQTTPSDVAPPRQGEGVDRKRGTNRTCPLLSGERNRRRNAS